MGGSGNEHFFQGVVHDTESKVEAGEAGEVPAKQHVSHNIMIIMMTMIMI